MKRNTNYKPPFPWFGGKSAVADKVWSALGDVKNYVEPPGKGDRAAWLLSYLGWFADRLRNVRVCCGDWSRVCGPSVTFRHGPTGVFLDPPYADTAGRTAKLYPVDCQQVAHAVREWAIEQGQNPLMRIVLAGYEGEHDMPRTWHCEKWQARGGYSLSGKNDNAKGRANRRRERLWFSPGCLIGKKKSTERLVGVAA